MLTKSLQGYVSQWLSCKMQLFPEKLLFNFPEVKTKAQQQKVQFNHFAPNPITEAARYWAKAQKAAGNASSGATVNAEAADSESQAKRSQHVFSHGSVAKWLKACCWGLGHNGRHKSLSHHACQVKASTTCHAIWPCFQDATLFDLNHIMLPHFATLHTSCCLPFFIP